MQERITEKNRLKEKVAQLFMLGYEGETPGPVLDKFLSAGLGGIIFFRDNFQSMTQASQAQALLSGFQKQRKAGAPELFLSLDQEGGQVERLPHAIFPSLVTPRAIGLSKDPQALAETTYTVMAEHLAALGFNLNYAPTLDVNLEAKNPIIGVRAFADDAKTVWRLAKIAKDDFWDTGIIPLGKHFPGHGNGTVDSHLKLPHLQFSEEELSAFQAAIDDNIPAMLVSHGFYPALQKKPDEFEQPASASKTIIQEVLKKRCCFQGLILSDDMCMGAITQEKNPIEAAIASLEAGIDLLVYKQSTESEWAVYQGILSAIEQGRLSRQRIEEAYQKVISLKQERARQAAKAKLSVPAISQWDADYLSGVTLPIAKSAITVLSSQAPQATALSLTPKNSYLKNSYLLVHPDRASITNYRFDQPTSPELPELLKTDGWTNLEAIAYRVEPTGQHFGQHQEENTLLAQLPDKHFSAVIFVSFNPLIQPIQQALYAQIKARYPETPMILVSAGTAYDKQVFEGVMTHIALCSYRPPSMTALAETLTHLLKDTQQLIGKSV